MSVVSFLFKHEQLWLVLRRKRYLCIWKSNMILVHVMQHRIFYLANKYSKSRQYKQPHWRCFCWYTSLEFSYRAIHIYLVGKSILGNCNKKYYSHNITYSNLNWYYNNRCFANINFLHVPYLAYHYKMKDSYFNYALYVFQQFEYLYFSV